MTPGTDAPVPRGPVDRGLLVLGAVFAASVALLLVAGEVGDRVAALYPGALPPHPYLVPRHALLLYVLWPASVVATTYVIVFPGACLAWLRGRSRSLASFAVETFVLGIAVQILAHVLIWRADVTDRAPAAAVDDMVIAGALAWIVAAAARWRREGPLNWTDGDGRRLAWLVLLPALAAAALLPILCWQDFNPDGLEAFTAGRSLLSHMLPLLPSGRASGVGLGMATEAFPVHWYMVWLGARASAARLPLVLVLPFLVAGLVAVAEQGAARRLTRAEEAAAALGTVAVVLTIVWNTTYHPYAADIASPGAIDLLATTLIVAATAALFAGDGAVFVAAALLGSFTRPTMLLWLTLVGAASLLLAPRERRRLAWLVAGAVGCVLAGALLERVVGPLAGIRFEQDSGALLHRLRFVRVTDLRRIAFLIVPAGIVPALAMLAWKRLDRTSRILALATIAYFGFFYVIAFTAPHHFLPAMLMPVAVLWRLALGRPATRLLPAAAAVGAAVAVLLALPRTFAVDREMRAIGAETVYREGEYRGTFEGYRAAFDHREILYALFPEYAPGTDAARIRIGHPWLQVHYSSRLGPGAPGINYVVQPASVPAPAGMTMVARDSADAVYVADMARWQRERATPPRTDFRSRLYDVPPTTLLERWGRPARAYDFDVRAVLEHLTGRRLGPVEP